MKIIITHPDFADPGGVANYYLKLKNKFTLPVQHHIIGKRPGCSGLWSNLRRLAGDYAEFWKNIQHHKNKIVVVNPSLDLKSVLRDGIFLFLAKMRKCKTIVFFRGWHKDFEHKLRQNRLWLFDFLFRRTDAFIVLSYEIKRILKEWGYTQPIYNEVTVVDDDAFQGFDINKAIVERGSFQKRRILFLSRVIITKGIYETIKGFSLLQSKYRNIELIITGDGAELESVKLFVKNHAIPNITFTGYVQGEKKKRILERAHVFCLPSYGEGLPNVVIEAMAFGLPVVTRLVGGLADFFVDGQNGFITRSKDPEIFAKLIERLLVDEDLYKKISYFNFNYAQSNFLASQAALRLEKIYNSLNLNT